MGYDINELFLATAGDATRSSKPEKGDEMNLRFLSNIHDPKDPHARMYMVYSIRAFRSPQAMQFEWEQYMRWVNENVIGEPKATEAYTSEQLRNMGMVGLYAREG